MKNIFSMIAISTLFLLGSNPAFATPAQFKNGVLASSGTVSNPAYSFFANPSTGIYLKSPGALSLAVDGADRINISDPAFIQFTTSAGSDHNFEVVQPSNGYSVNMSLKGANSVGAAYNNINSSYGSTQNWYVGGGGVDQTLMFKTAGSERMRINSGGSVGIGTAAPSSLLSVNGSADISSLTLTTPLAATYVGSLPASKVTSGTFASAQLGTINSSLIAPSPAFSGTMTSSTTGADEVAIFNASTAGYAVNMQLVGNDNGGSSYNNVTSKYGSTEQWAIGGYGNAATMVLRTNGTERMRLDSNGVTIGSNLLANDSNIFFRNTSDTTKLLTLNLSGIGTGTTKTLTMPNANVDLGNLTNSNISSSAAIAYSKLALSNSIVNGDIGSSAAIALSKLAALTTGKTLQSNASTGAIEASSVTNTELGYVSGVTSAIQTQLNALAPQASPTFTGTVIAPIVSGGSGTTSTLTIKPTTGVGTTNADIIFQTGNNGASEAMRILNGGNIGFGVNSASLYGSVTQTKAFNMLGQLVVGSSAQGTDGDGLIALARNGGLVSGANWNGNGLLGWNLYTHSTGATATKYRTPITATGYAGVEAFGGGLLSFYTNGSAQTAGTDVSPTLRMRIDANGYGYFNTTTQRNSSLFSLDFSSSAPGAGFGINNTDSANGAGYITFLSGGTFRGSITNNNNTAVAYNTTSDYRLKENIKPLTGALDKVMKLKPSTFNYKSNPSIVTTGFIAHDLQSVIPEAVTGKKDEMNADGTPKYQQIDPRFIVATLTAALQEVKRKEDELERRLMEVEKCGN